MNNQSYTQGQILNIILELAYPNPKERQTIDRTKIKEHFDWFYDFVEFCNGKEDFIDCLKDFELDLLDTILEIMEDKI